MWELSKPDLAVSIATALALTYADDAYPRDSLARLTTDAPAGGSAAHSIDMAITNLVKQTFTAISGHTSGFPNINSVVKRCRDEGIKVQADWEAGRQLSVAIWWGDTPKVQATLVFGTDGNPKESIPGIWSTPEGLKAMCSDYSL